MRLCSWSRPDLSWKIFIESARTAGLEVCALQQCQNDWYNEAHQLQYKLLKDRASSRDKAYLSNASEEEGGKLDTQIASLTAELLTEKKKRKKQFEQRRDEEFESAWLRDPGSTLTYKLACRYAFGSIKMSWHRL